MSANSAVAIKRSAGVGRYDLCPCGSGRKYKHCCLGKDSDPETAVQRSNLRLFTAAGIRSTHACRSSSPISRQSRLCVGSRGIEFAYRQYERLMEHRRRVLPKDRFTEARYETLVAERESEMQRLIALCGLDWDEACLAPARNPRQLNTASLWQARQPVYGSPFERWRRYAPWLGERRELLPAAPPEPS